MARELPRRTSVRRRDEAAAAAPAQLARGSRPATRGGAAPSARPRKGEMRDVPDGKGDARPASKGEPKPIAGKALPNANIELVKAGWHLASIGVSTFADRCTWLAHVL